jgi:hypothetical protein
MNLHSIVNKAPKWFWCNLFGRRYSPIGTHIWLIERGTPPPLEPPPYRRWHVPPRFNWTPYAASARTMLPPPRPLCGFRTHAQTPRIDIDYNRYYEKCPRCLEIASIRDILITPFSALDQDFPENAQLLSEYETWRAHN